MIDFEIFRQLALSLAHTTELPHFKRTSFRVKGKIFATGDHEAQLAVLLLTQVQQSVYCLADATAFYPVDGAWGKKGATNVNLKKVRRKLFKEALCMAWSNKAHGKKTVR